MFSIAGAFPLWRDLSPGITGDDVRELQDALRRVGYPIRDRELGTFGSSTYTAVKRMYESAGYTLLTTPGEVSAPPVVSAAAPGEGASGDAAPPPPPVPVIPVSEIVVVTGELPARLASVPPVGTVLDAANARVSVDAGEPSAAADLPAAVAARVPIGTKGTLAVGSEPTVAVSVAQLVPGDPTTATDPSVVLQAEAGTALPPSWVGSTGLLTLTLTESAPDSLLVPTRAVAVAVDGSMSVARRQPDGSLLVVLVTVIGELRGVSAVRPAQEGTLKVDDQVRVG